MRLMWQVKIGLDFGNIKTSPCIAKEYKWCCKWTNYFFNYTIIVHVTEMVTMKYLDGHCMTYKMSLTIIFNDMLSTNDVVVTDHVLSQNKKLLVI